MARLLTSGGGEIRDHPTSDIGSPDGFAAGVAMCVTDTTVVRSGSASIKCPGTSTDTSFRVWPFATPAAGVAVMPRIYWRCSALPTATATVAALVTSADGALISARLTSAGLLQLWNDAGSAQIGSDSALTVEADRWYRLQFRLVIAAGAADEAALYAKVDDYQVAEETVSSATGLTISDTHAGRLRGGWVNAPGQTSNAFTEDVIVNDSTGTVQNTFPGDSGIAIARPATAGSVGSWLECSGAAATADGVNKTPPIGIADHSTAGHTGASAHQDRVLVNTLQAMTVNISSYAAAGVPVPSGNFPNSEATGSTSNQPIGSSSTVQMRAQSFKFGQDVAVDTVTVKLVKVGSPTDNIIVELHGDSSGLPGATVLASGSLAASPLPASFTPSPPRRIVRLDTTVNLTAGASYWIVLKRSGAFDGTNYVQWGRGITNGYPDGAPAYYTGTAWSQAGINHSVNDHLFGVFTTQPSAKVLSVSAVACHGQAVTGAKGGLLDSLVALGGATTTQKTFNFGDNVGVAGTYPSNWRWAVSASLTSTKVRYENLATLTITKNAGSGTNPVMCCFAGLLVEFGEPPQGWLRYIKSDSTFWWAKRVSGVTDFELADGSIVTVAAGDYAIYPEPQVVEGGDFPATLVAIDEATLVTTYTLV
jgi:hypothetical protein